MPMKEFKVAFYVFRHAAPCHGQLQIDEFGVREDYQVVFVGTCRKCGQKDVICCMSFDDLSQTIANLKEPAAEFTVRDIAEFKAMHIAMPPDPKLLPPAA